MDVLNALSITSSSSVFVFWLPEIFKLFIFQYQHAQCNCNNRLHLKKLYHKHFSIIEHSQGKVQ